MFIIPIYLYIHLLMTISCRNSLFTLVNSMQVNPLLYLLHFIMSRVIYCDKKKTQSVNIKTLNIVGFCLFRLFVYLMHPQTTSLNISNLFCQIHYDVIANVMYCFINVFYYCKKIMIKIKNDGWSLSFQAICSSLKEELYINIQET